MIDLFPTNTAFHYKMRKSLVDYWDVLNPFTAEDPLVSKWRNAKFLQICSNEETNSDIYFMTWEREKSESEYIFSKFKFLGELLIKIYMF